MKLMAAKTAQLSMLSRTKTAKMSIHSSKCGLNYAEKMTWAYLPVLWGNIEPVSEGHQNNRDDPTRSP